MLNFGLYCLMKFCSVSSASASVTTTSGWMSSISDVSAVVPYIVGFEK